VKVASGGYAPPRVMLQDEFASGPVPATVNPVPVELCLPTEKIVGTRVFKIINPAMHLLCFPVSPTPIGREPVRHLRGSDPRDELAVPALDEADRPNGGHLRSGLAG